MERLPDVVRTPRLSLRRWCQDDADGLSAAITASIDRLRPWMPWAAHEPATDSERRETLQRFEDEWEAGGDVVLGVFLGDTIIGGSGLHRRRGPNTLEIGYWVHAAHTGNGFAHEVATALTATALTVPGIDRVEIHHDRANVASRRVPERLGFAFDGETVDGKEAPAEEGIDWGWSTGSPHTAPLLTDGVVRLGVLARSDAIEHLDGEDEELWRWLSGAPATLDIVEQFIERNRASWRERGPRRNFGVWEVTSGRLVGNAEANFADDALGAGEVNVSYAVWPRWRGRGYAARAVRLLARWLEDEASADLAVAQVHPDNEPSSRVARAAGFVDAGEHFDGEQLMRRFVRPVDLTK